ncbi:hypothetical protein CGC45_05955 [Francisella opportunistica]|uniref:Photosystem II reaction center protein Z n=1 Tax=Francisella opportunistica TaxID=2016517 RepID=A0A345JS60_9GAMM|nr:hypothetical protein CGC43_05960 [Francisella opportunistica]AXH31798.1 hypothetical protein CGC44_05945 [Francisella opportunistica]AXH33444.1 hypothetical protein CGC45_05955 [Francisella opportunistica]
MVLLLLIAALLRVFETLLTALLTVSLATFIGSPLMFATKSNVPMSKRKIKSGIFIFSMIFLRKFFI